MVNSDPSIKFVSFKEETQTLIVEPSTSLGFFQILLVSNSTSVPPLKLIQKVIIKSYPSNGVVYKDIEATISSISSVGVVNIDFNQKMTIPVNASKVISDEALNLYITNSRQGSKGIRPNFTWSTQSFS
jgi:hypothetical protein